MLRHNPALLAAVSAQHTQALEKSLAAAKAFASATQAVLDTTDSKPEDKDSLHESMFEAGIGFLNYTTLSDDDIHSKLEDCNTQISLLMLNQRASKLEASRLESERLSLNLEYETYTLRLNLQKAITPEESQQAVALKKALIEKQLELELANSQLSKDDWSIHILKTHKVYLDNIITFIKCGRALDTVTRHPIPSDDPSNPVENPPTLGKTALAIHQANIAAAQARFAQAVASESSLDKTLLAIKENIRREMAGLVPFESYNQIVQAKDKLSIAARDTAQAKADLFNKLESDADVSACNVASNNLNTPLSALNEVEKLQLRLDNAYLALTIAESSLFHSLITLAESYVIHFKNEILRYHQTFSVESQRKNAEETARSEVDEALDKNKCMKETSVASPSVSKQGTFARSRSKSFSAFGRTAENEAPDIATLKLGS